MNKNHLIVLLAAYVVSTAGSYAAFTKLDVPKPQVITEETQGESALGALLDTAGAPKDQACPLNGKMFTQAEKAAWEKRRPLAVMIENSPDARPQSGISDADIVFEAIAEGGVTRFMAMFYCGTQLYDTTLAPIRSARTYYLDWASGFNFPMYVHVGGANVPGPTDALGQINQYGWASQNDINQFSVGFPTFVRDANRLGKPVATEHTMVTSTELLWDVAEKRGWSNMAPARRIAGQAVAENDWKDGYKGWTFQDEEPADGTVTSVAYDFWSGYGQYSNKWTYNPTTKSFDRTMGGESHIDLNNDKQISAANVIVILTEERGPLNEEKHMIYKTIGAGEALIFKNGLAIEGRWSKQNRTSELQFVDNKGAAIELARGLTWISVVDDSTEVVY
jgi:hypothetical protein